MTGWQCGQGPGQGLLGRNLAEPPDARRVQLPFAGAVACIRPGGRKPYFVGLVRSLKFEFSPCRSIGLGR